LTDLAKDIIAFNNVALNTISMPALLQMPGGLQVLNNTALQNFSGFPQLREIEQNVDIEGPLDAVSFPQLRTFYGSNFAVSSSHSNLNCTELDAYAYGNPAIIRGSYICTAAAPSTTGTPGTRTSPDISLKPTSTGPGGLPTGEKAGIAVEVILVASLVLVLNWFLLRKRKKA
jgi:hypothetical protein